ncbi:hypothetical protein RB4927 [Rhodopirellula baltica SH 1]|uniref:Uncharacterized protein n=1 Tax=Rhodopirellula baltica (strain DSM 10527 / NCIMB 13988 / SH1) TaxID=243090 RepID=Q7UGZ6_RHOBA|nr:hypothetical protein RB4927 [Rhodopirellula baltica SH 1]
MDWDGEETTGVSNLQSRAGDRNKGLSRPPVSDWWEEMDPLEQSHRLRQTAILSREWPFWQRECSVASN